MAWRTLFALSFLLTAVLLTAAAQAGFRVLGDGFEKEGFVLVDLHEMVAARGLL